MPRAVPSRFPLDEQGRCALCRRGLLGFDAAYSFGFYEAELRELIHLFKYGGRADAGQTAGAFAGAARCRGSRVSMSIVPMPLHWRKRWRRGFNQSELLAREISRRTHVPVENALRRVRNTAAQAGLDQRQAADQCVRRVSRKRTARFWRGKRVLLVDDVMTTGATAASCARVLKRAGAAAGDFTDAGARRPPHGF